MIATPDPKPATARFYMLRADIAARTDLEATDKLALAAIEGRYGDNGESWPSLQRIANDIGTHVATAFRSVKRLEAAGLVTVERRPRPKSNVYRPVCETANSSTERIYAGSEYRQEANRDIRTELIELDKGNKIKPTTPKGSKREAVTWDESGLRFIVPDGILSAWQRDFPLVNVAAEVGRAGQWHAANRKWKSAFQAALVRWLGRAGNGGSNGRFTPATVASVSEYDAIGTRF